MPNGAAANLASGGIGPVAILSGKLLALASGRPLASFKSGGRRSVKALRSGSGWGNCRRSMSASASVLSSMIGACSPLSPTRRANSARRRGTGALNFNSIGRIGKQPACAFSRSQLVLAVNGSRTVKPKRRSMRLGTPLGVATPAPYTTCTRLAGVRRRAH